VRATRARVAACLAATFVLAGCGDQASGGTTDPAADSPVAVVDDEVLVSCGGRAPGWPPSAMVDGIEGETPRAEIAAALDAVATEPKLSVETSRVLPQGGQTPWKLLTDDAEHLTIALGEWTLDGPTREAMTMSLEREGDGWKWTGHGSCWTLSPLLDQGESWVQVGASVAVQGDATEIAVDVNETACTGARDPAPHLNEPVIVSTDESVTVYWTSKPPVGGANCPSNPTSSQVLVLDEPLGDRPLLDGSRWPPVLVGQGG
jgi:hypothetical protein